MHKPSLDGPPQVELEGFGPVDLYQRREKIITRHVDGVFQKLRFYTGWPLLLGYFVTPWLTWGDRQMVLFDLPARQFHILGLTFWPQDLWLLGWLLMIGAFALFTVTTIVGRLWCGYTCPQTVWTAIYMWVEQFAEGSRHQRMRLETAAWSLEKLRKRTLKHGMWLGVAALTGLTFVGYFTPIRELAWQLLTVDTAALSGWAVFWVVFFTAATYVNAGWMREQVCIYMCPYARFQSAMIDRDTLIVSYDDQRGEPRSSRKRGTASVAGDCIDCQLCVQVCPTGIDIRDGLQYQCIGCAHCIDACNQVMDKMGSPRDLISYTTLNALEGGPVRWLRPRSIGYAAVVVTLVVAFLFAVTMRAPMAFDVLRDRGALYNKLPDGRIANDYQLKVMNKGQQDARFQLNVLAPAWVHIATAASFELAPGEVRNLPLVLTANPEDARNDTVRLAVCRDKRCVEEVTPFIAPGAGS